MTRVLLKSLDEELVADALAKFPKRDVYVAVDATVLNGQIAQKLGLDRYALVGSDVDAALYESYPTSAPAKKASPKPKKVEAKKDDKPKSE